MHTGISLGIQEAITFSQRGAETFTHLCIAPGLSCMWISLRLQSAKIWGSYDNSKFWHVFPKPCGAHFRCPYSITHHGHASMILATKLAAQASLVNLLFRNVFWETYNHLCGKTSPNTIMGVLMQHPGRFLVDTSFGQPGKYSCILYTKIYIVWKYPMYNFETIFTDVQRHARFTEVEVMQRVNCMTAKHSNIQDNFRRCLKQGAERQNSK